MRNLLALFVLVTPACGGGGGGGGGGGSGGGGGGAVDNDGDGALDTVDCDDNDATIFPGAWEGCDGVDEDCDGAVDEGVGHLWFPDGDGDGYGIWSGSVTACSQPTGFVSSFDDCDDTDAATHPGAIEDCDGGDEDCDGHIDETASGPTTWYPDTDGDGYGYGGAPTHACAQPAGYVADSADCDDADPRTYPGAHEHCDAKQNDCDDGSWSGDMGIATFEYASGSWSDVSGDFTGSHGAPVDWHLPADGALRLCAGTWYTALNANSRTAKIWGPEGAGVTTVITGSAHPAINFNHSTLEVEGLTLTQSAGGLHGQYTALTATDVVVHDNAGAVGGGLNLFDVTLDATRLTVTDNTTTHSYYQGAGMLLTTVTGTIRDSTIEGNDGVQYGGGIHLTDGALTLIRTDIVDNGAAVRGGGLYVQKATATLDDVEISDNTASVLGAGIYVYDDAQVFVTNSDFANNVPEDVYNIYDYTAYTWGLGASFTCDSSGCY